MRKQPPLTSEFDTAYERQIRSHGGLSYPSRTHDLIQAVAKANGVGQGRALFEILNAVWDPDHAQERYPIAMTAGQIPWLPRDASMQRKKSKTRTVYWPYPTWETLDICKRRGLGRGDLVEATCACWWFFLRGEPLPLGWATKAAFGWWVRRGQRGENMDPGQYRDFRDYYYRPELKGVERVRDPWFLDPIGVQ